MQTYRAAYWTNGHDDVRLTNAEHQCLSDADLMVVAQQEIDAVGLAINDGRIEIGNYTE